MRPQQEPYPVKGSEDTPDKITGHVQRLLERLAALSTETERTATGLVRDILGELTTTVEELRVAEEEMRVQNEELAHTVLRVEVERRRYVDLFDAAPDAYLVTDLHGVVREANRAASALLGMATRYLLGKPFVNFVQPDARPAFRSRLLDMPQITQSQEWELELQPRHGPPLIAAVTVAAMPGEDGRPATLRWLIRDIGPRRAAEAERYRMLIESVKDYAVFMLDTDGRVTHWNPASERILGYSAGEIIGRSGDVIFTPEDRAAGAPQQEMGTAKAIGRAEDERWHLRKDGRRFWGSGVMTGLRDAAGRLTAYAKVMRDLTARHEEQERQAVDSLRHQQMAALFQETILEAVATDSVPGLEVAALSEADGEEADIGGDYYDVFPLGETRVALIVGDVTGKGLAAARRTAEAKFAVRAFLYQHEDLSGAISALNGYLCAFHPRAASPEEPFVAMAVAVVDTAAWKISLVAAGCEPPLVLRADGTAADVGKGDLALGVVPNAVYTAHTVPLQPSETFILMTDGITGARNDRREFLDYAGVVALAQEARGAATLRGMAQAILAGAQGFVGGRLSDDICLLLARRR